jgi:hypothetical protein
MSAQLNIWPLKWLNPEIPKNVRGGMFDEWSRAVIKEEQEKMYELRKTLRVLNFPGQSWEEQLFPGKFSMFFKRQFEPYGARPAF